ncbi:MAG: HAD-IC family P-type ATPase, partial [Pirellulales bacterium]
MFNPLDRSQPEQPHKVFAEFWAVSANDLFQALDSSPQGLSSENAHAKLAQSSRSGKQRSPHQSTILLLLAQFKSPITLILIAAAILSFFLHDMLDAAIVLGIVLVSAILGFLQEHSATNSVRKLLELVRTNTTVIRDGTEAVVDQSEVVPGDVICLSAGDTIPADCRLIEGRDLFVDEAALTGETFPVEKAVTDLNADCGLSDRINSFWQGTHVVSGSGRAVAVVTGDKTQFGYISQRLKYRPPETDFEKGVRKFGYLLMEFTLLLVGGIFFVNVYFERPVIDAFLFSLALAVGLTPQLLPAIITVNLSFGAKRMAEREVIVKRLSSIENFGSMNVLCSDKTGTLTEGTARVNSAVDANGLPSDKVLQFAFVNASFETGFINPIDSAIRTTNACDLSMFKKLDEVPYDFIRRRLSVLVASGGHTLLITKGSVDNILEICEQVELVDGSIHPIDDLRETIQAKYTAFGLAGKRTLGVAYRRELGSQVVDKSSEKEMTFIGFLLLEDPLKANIVETIQSLSKLGIGLKVITGDNRRVAASLADRVGLSSDCLLCGKELYEISDEALVRLVGETQVFAEIEPNQKERI